MSEDDNITNPHIMATLESLMRITLAGFGGALAGISISRRGGLGTAANKVQTLAKTSATTTSSSSNVKKLSRQQRRQAIRSAPPVLRPTIDRELPSAWAVACMAFAGVVEFTRLVSPTTFVSQFVTTPSSLEGEADNEVAEDSKTILVNKEETIKQYGTTIIDYMIGGGIAGALFKGSAVRTPAGARIDASIMGSSSISSTATTSSLSAIKSSRPLSGILPGAALGLLAGVTIVTMEYAQKQLEETFGEDVVDEETEEDNVSKNNNDDIPEDIKAMTTEELLASIQSLKSGRDESSNHHQGKEVKGEPDTEQINTDKAPNLLYSLGFRPHSSSS